MKDKNWKKETKEFWDGIILKKNGDVNLGQVYKELHDYKFLMEQASKVYEHITGLSKTNYYANVIISEYEERNYGKDITRDDVRNIIKNNKTLEDIIDDLKEYFEL